MLARADIDAALRQHQPLVRRLAHQMIAKLPANVELDDLVQVGMVGLWQALNRFDEARGVQFNTFATQRIRGAMLDQLRGQDTLSKGDRRSAGRNDTAVRTLEHRLGRRPTEGEVAQHLGMELGAYQELLATVRAAQVTRLEDMNGDDGDADYLDRHTDGHAADPFEVLDQAQTDAAAQAVAAARIKDLPDREWYIMNQRISRERDLDAIGADLGVSGSRVCQIEKGAREMLTAGGALADPKREAKIKRKFERVDMSAVQPVTPPVFFVRTAKSGHEDAWKRLPVGQAYELPAAQAKSLYYKAHELKGKASIRKHPTKDGWAYLVRLA